MPDIYQEVINWRTRQVTVTLPDPAIQQEAQRRNRRPEDVRDAWERLREEADQCFMDPETYRKNIIEKCGFDPLFS